jgi:Putative MetA-pathway of phenol degradation
MHFHTGRRMAPMQLCCALIILMVQYGIAVGQELGVSTSDSNSNYIDNAVVGNMFRIRFDAAYGNTRPDRAEFLYAKCGCFGLGSDSPGPPDLETSVDYQIIQADLEYVIKDGFSAFVEAPIRFLNPEQNDNAAGFSDLQAGFKYSLWNCEHRAVTFQFRTYIPTGNASQGLGTEHVSLEPALLWLERLSDRLTLEAEFRDWIPIDASSAAGVAGASASDSFSGNILRYGVGLGYNLVDDGRYRLTPIAELVGWTVLGGFATVSPDGTAATVSDATGDTIVNFKFGTRLTINDRDSFSVGYGRALTGDTWYSDVLRVEYRTAY